MSNSLSAISLDTIKRARNLTLSQKAVLGEIHSLASRGKEFYAWNSYLSEKLGIGRSTTANALTFFYKNGITSSKCERNDGKTARITKRYITINYKKLALFLETPINPQISKRQPLHEPTKENPVAIIREFEAIDFTQAPKVIKNQWAEWMVNWLDKETGRVNTRSKETKAVLKILNDSTTYLLSTSGINPTSGKDIETLEVGLIENRRTEEAIKYGVRAMKKGIWKEYPDEDYVPVENMNLTFNYMRNIFPAWGDILAYAYSKDTGCFRPETNPDDDIQGVYFSDDGVRNDNENGAGVTETAVEIEENLQEPEPPTDYETITEEKLYERLEKMGASPQRIVENMRKLGYLEPELPQVSDSPL